jgi:hypothetical protein
MSISAVPASSASVAAFVQEVDFPAFVSGLIENVFQANLDVSVQQAQACVGLMADESANTDHGRDPRVAEAFDAASSRDDGQSAGERRPLLATMVMMGINRIVVTDGKI